MSDANLHFDIFLSHSYTQKTWVEILARNLQAQGVSVWLDKWQLKGGDRWTERLQEGLDRSSIGVLVVTDEAQTSGWVQDEYDTMLRHKNSERTSFRILPILLSSGDGFPFLNNVQAIDFRDHNAYRRHFYTLLCAIRGEMPDPDVCFEGALELPDAPTRRDLAPSRKSFLDRFFDKLEFGNHLALLLAQDGMDTGPVTEELLSRARQNYGADHVLHLVAPVTEGAELEAYFSELGRQCAIGDDLASGDRIGAELARRMAGGARLCVIVSNFEQGAKEARKRLGRMVRLLAEKHPETLRVIFRGGEGLVALSLEESEISALRIAEKVLWPELTPADLQSFYQTRHGDLLNEEDAIVFLDVTGGEPRLTERCCEFHASIGKGYGIEDLHSYVFDSDSFWYLVRSCAGGRVDEAVLCDAFTRDVLGPGVGYPLDLPERRLFWRNLLTRRTVDRRRRLVWRSENLRQAGLDILRCA